MLSTVLAASLRSLLIMVIRLAHLGFRMALLKTEAELRLALPSRDMAQGLEGWVPETARSG